MFHLMGLPDGGRCCCCCCCGGGTFSAESVTATRPALESREAEGMRVAETEVDTRCGPPPPLPPPSAERLTVSAEEAGWWWMTCVEAALPDGMRPLRRQRTAAATSAWLMATPGDRNYT